MKEGKPILKRSYKREAV